MTKPVFPVLLLALSSWACSASEGNNVSATGGTNGTGTSTTATGTPTCSLGDIAWYLENIAPANLADGTDDGAPTWAGQKMANAYGLFDMLGNAPEWTQDCYGSSYAGAPADGSASPTLCDPNGNFVSRGGCAGQAASAIRVSARESTPASGYGGCMTGFRCVTVAAVPSTQVLWGNIPAGSFIMGCSPGDTDCLTDESVTHPVSVANFLMMTTEVTNALYYAPDLVTYPNHPVTAIQHSDAAAYCAKLGGRLPTEAEWEYAARGGTATRNYCGS